MLSVLSKKIRHLLDCYPSGISLGSLRVAYRRRFSEDLKPAQYGCIDIENLIRAIPCVAKLSADQEGSGFIVSRVYERDEMSSKISNEVASENNTTAKDNADVPTIQNVVERIDIMGINATAKDNAEVPTIQNGVEGTDLMGIQNNNESVVQDVVEHSSTKMISPLKDKLPQLPDETKGRLKDLLKNHFSDGLTLNELLGAYRGFYGATLEDLDPLQYGYCSLEEMLKANCDFATLKYCGGEIMLHYIDPSTSKWDNSDNSLLIEDTWDVKAYISLPAVNAVDPGKRYTRYNASQFYQPETMTEVVVGEVYSASDFWIIHRGLETSQALDALMDQMMEFYSSPIGERYKITKENIQIGAPVAALYKEDDNWYRAIVTDFVDLISVKLFFCDYGTKSFVFNTSLRKLHTKFLDLPVQAIKGRLHGIKPVNDAKKLWPRKSSKRLLELLQDKALVANIIKVENEVNLLKMKNDIVYMSLWDTSSSDINVSEILVAEGLAKWEEGNSSCEAITEERKDIVSSTHVFASSLITVNKQVEMPQHTYEDANILRVPSYSSNSCFDINCNNPNRDNNNTFLASNIEQSYIPQMDPFKHSSLFTNCTNTEQLKYIETDIKGSNDNENTELITEENFKLKHLLEEFNKLLRKEDKCNEGLNTGECKEVQPNDLHINIKENGCADIDQPVPILASTPRQDNIVANEALNVSSISPLTITPKKVPFVPPGFNIKLNLPSTVSSIPPGYAFLPGNFNEIPTIPQELQMGTDNPILTPLSNSNYHEYPIDTQSIAPNNTIYPSSLNQKGCELPIETQSTQVTRQHLSTAPSPVLEELPISYSFPKEQIIKQKHQTNTEDETFFSDEDLGGSSLSLNIACRTVECYSLTSNYRVHILKLSGAPYILSGEVSQVLWDTDKLRIALAKKKKDLPYIILNQTTHPDIFQQLINLKAAAALDGLGEPLMSLFAYPLQVVPRILQIFKKDHGAVMKAFQELLMIYKDDPDYIPFDESFVWPDNEDSSQSYPKEDDVINYESSSQSYPSEDAVKNEEITLNPQTGSNKKEKEGSLDEKNNLTCVHGFEDCAFCGSNIKVPSNILGIRQNSIYDNSYILKNKVLIENSGHVEYKNNEQLNENLNNSGNFNSADRLEADDLYAGRGNLANNGSHKYIEDKGNLNHSYGKVGSNISSNCSTKSLEDMDIDNSSIRSTSDTSTFLSTSDNILKNKVLIENSGHVEYKNNEQLNEKLNNSGNFTSTDRLEADDLYAGGGNLVNNSSHKFVEDKGKLNHSYGKVGSNISSNCSTKSLEDMDIDNSSIRSTSDTSTFLSTSDTSALSPETQSLHAIKKRMNLMYKKKQSNLQNLILKASNKPNESIKKIKLPKELTVVNNDLKLSEKSTLVNLPISSESNHFNSSYDKKQGFLIDNFKNSNKVSQITNDNDKTNSELINYEVETICTDTIYGVETINPNTDNTITIQSNAPIYNLCDPYSFNFADSIPNDRMLQEMNYNNDGNNFKMLPSSNTVVYNQFPQSNPMSYPRYMPQLMPHMGHMQGLPCIYYPVPTPIFPMPPMPQMPQEHYKRI